MKDCELHEIIRAIKEQATKLQKSILSSIEPLDNESNKLKNAYLHGLNATLYALKRKDIDFITGYTKEIFEK